MIELIKDQIKERIEILEKESIDLGCDLQFDEAKLKMNRRDELWDLEYFIKKLEWKALDDRINYMKPNLLDLNNQPPSNLENFNYGKEETPTL